MYLPSSAVGSPDIANGGDGNDGEEVEREPSSVRGREAARGRRSEDNHRNARARSVTRSRRRSRDKSARKIALGKQSAGRVCIHRSGPPRRGWKKSRKSGRRLAGTVSRASQNANRAGMAAHAAECRICGDGSEDAALTQPCGCKGTSAHAHHACVQEWVARSGRRACEVCGEPWVGAFDFPSPSCAEAADVPSPEESTRRVLSLLTAAHERLVAGDGAVSRPLDEHMLLTLGPHFPGPWLSWVRARELSRRRSAYGRAKRAARELIGGLFRRPSRWHTRALMCP